MLLWTFGCNCKHMGRCWLVINPVPSLHEPGAALVAPPWMYGGANSPWPTLMPPESVPALLYIRLLTIPTTCAQPCTTLPPPPWELLVIVNPSILEGLQMKLLGNGLVVT